MPSHFRHDPQVRAGRRSRCSSRTRALPIAIAASRRTRLPKGARHELVPTSSGLAHLLLSAPPGFVPTKPTVQLLLRAAAGSPTRTHARLDRSFLNDASRRCHHLLPRSPQPAIHSAQQLSRTCSAKRCACEHRGARSGATRPRSVGRARSGATRHRCVDVRCVAFGVSLVWSSSRAAIARVRSVLRREPKDEAAREGEGCASTDPRLANRGGTSSVCPLDDVRDRIDDIR